MAKKVAKKKVRKKAPAEKQKFKLGTIKKVPVNEDATPSKVYNVYAYTSTCTYSCCGATFCC